MSSAAAKILELRSLLAERFPAPAAPPKQIYPTGQVQLDQVLGGGLQRGAITEIVRPGPGAGAGLLLHSIIAQVAENGGRVALIDGRDTFDPDDFENATLSRLLWIRCKSADIAVKAADWLWRDGNLPLSVLDLSLNPLAELRRIPTSTWHRLARAAEDRGLACLTFTPQALVASATARLELVHRFTLAALEADRARLVGALGWRWLRRRGAFAPADNIIAFPKASAA